MHSNHYDIIIVGQGICGTVLSSSLILQGQKVLVIDDGSNKAASKIASGVINPVTGRRIVKTWQIDEVMPAAVRIYKALENKLNTQILQQCNIVNFHASEQMQKAFEDRIAEDPTYLSTQPLPNKIAAAFMAPFGHTVIDPCWLIQLENLLHYWRQYLIEKNTLLQDVFDFKKLDITAEEIRLVGVKGEALGIVNLSEAFAQAEELDTDLVEIANAATKPVVIVGGSMDINSALEVLAKTTNKHVINTCGDFNLNQSASIVSQSYKLVTNDTGMMHIAACFGIPIVSVWGNTTPDLGMYPYYPNQPEKFSIHQVEGLNCRPCSKIGFQECPKKHFKCMNEQNVAEIIREVNN